MCKQRRNIISCTCDRANGVLCFFVAFAFAAMMIACAATCIPAALLGFVCMFVCVNTIEHAQKPTADRAAMNTTTPTTCPSVESFMYHSGIARRQFTTQPIIRRRRRRRWRRRNAALRMAPIFCQQFTQLTVVAMMNARLKCAPTRLVCVRVRWCAARLCLWPTD